MPSASVQPITNAARRPNASRANTYLPPALGCRVASSAKTSAPKSPTRPPSAQATKVSHGRPSKPATTPGVRKIPEPTMMPTTIARPSVARSVRRSPAPALATPPLARGPLLERQPYGGVEHGLVLLVHELLDDRALRVDEEEGREDAHRAEGFLHGRRQVGEREAEPLLR